MASISHTARIAASHKAARQHGVVTFHQLVAAGFAERSVARWAEAGRLHRMFRGVYSLGQPASSERARMMGAVLACAETQRLRNSPTPRDGAVVSHRSAGFLLGILERAPAVVEVICRGQQGREIDGIRAHPVATPSARECGWVDGIPCTSVARTLVDLAGVLSEKSLRDAVERAATKRALDLAAIEAVLALGRRRGAKRLRALVQEWRPVAELIEESKLRSPFEARLLPLLAAEQVPLPEVNARVPVADRVLEVDLLWRQARLVVEADSRRHHGIEVAFERDRKRDRDLFDAGYAVIRVTWRQAKSETPAIAASIRAFLNG